MGVLAEAISVVIRKGTLEERLPGGLEEYERRCPNDTLCYDESICRVGFMALADAQEYVDNLISLGFVGPNEQESTEIAIIDQESGLLFPCDWLQLGRQGDVTIAWLKGTELTHFAAPPSWKPGSMEKLSQAQMANDYEHIGTKGDVEVIRHRESGELKYVGRPRRPKDKK